MTGSDTPPASGTVSDGAVSLTMTLPPVPEIELVAIEGLNRLARHIGVEEVKIGDARILVAEAVINALEHAGGSGAGVTVEFALTSKELVIHVRDYGSGFDPTKVEDPTIESRIGSARKRGWGLKLMRSLSDEFHVESGPQGTTITIKKMLT